MISELVGRGWKWDWNEIAINSEKKVQCRSEHLGQEESKWIRPKKKWKGKRIRKTMKTTSVNKINIKNDILSCKKEIT